MCVCARARVRVALLCAYTPPCATRACDRSQKEQDKAYVQKLMELGTEAGMEAVPEERAQALELYRKEGDTSPPSHVFFTKK